MVQKILSRSHARKITVLCIAFGHISLFALATAGMLAYTVPSEYRFLLLMANNTLWLFIHLICAVYLIVALVRDRWYIPALSWSAGWMGAWGFLNLLGGASAIRPVSLAGPVLGIVLAATAYSVTMSWASLPQKRTQ